MQHIDAVYEYMRFVSCARETINVVLHVAAKNGHLNVKTTKRLRICAAFTGSQSGTTLQ